MRYLSNRQDEIINMVNLAMKLQGSKNRFQERLNQRYLETPSDYQVAVTYSFYHYYETIAMIQENQKLQMELTKILSIYDRILEQEKEDWFVQVLRLILLRKLPCEYMSDQEKVYEIEKTILLQEQSDYKKEYFIIPYILLSELHIRDGKEEEGIYDLIKGMEASIVNQIPYNGICVHFKLILRELMYLVNNNHYMRYKELIEEISKHYFHM